MQAIATQNITLSENNFRTIRDLVYEHCGINLNDGKKELVRARLVSRLREGKFKTFSDYIEHLQKNRDSREFLDFIDSLSTNLTSFFRENQHFQFLRENFLPSILEKKHDRKIRTWSAGCSSGEEAYSLAITLLEAIPQSQNWDIKVLATDISTRILNKAKNGIYDEQKIKPLPMALRQKYMLMNDLGNEKIFEVGNQIRNVVIFRYLNLIESWPIRGPLDFIFCRNVMIYFDKPTQETLVNRFWELLEPGGLLFTGHSESLTGINHKFSYIQPTIYAKL